MLDENDILLSREETRKLLGFKDIRSVDRLIREGEIKAYKLLKSVKISRRSVADYLGRQQIVPDEQASNQPSEYEAAGVLVA